MSWIAQKCCNLARTRHGLHNSDAKNRTCHGLRNSDAIWLEHVMDCTIVMQKTEHVLDCTIGMQLHSRSLS